MKSHRWVWYLLFAVSVGLSGCASDASVEVTGNTHEDDGDGVEEDLTSSVGMAAADIRAVNIGAFNLDLPTTLGRKVFQASRLWMSKQELRYAMPKNCANNVSIVLRSALRAEGILGSSSRMPYEAESVYQLVESVRGASGSHVVDMPILNSDGSFVALLNREFNGHIPVGTVVAGCPKSFPKCNGAGGSQHVALIGHTDSNGVVWVYHNNWLRPENLDGKRPPSLNPYMVSEANLAGGHPRQWMPTPWVRLTKNADGHVVKAERMLPQIDDLDPAQFFMKLAVIPEIQARLH
jgi:hypothetical protein